MNIIFTIIIILSMIIMLFISPDGVLSAMLSGGEKALSLTLRLVVVYAVFMAITELAERTDITKKMSKKLQPINKRLFGYLPPSSEGYVNMNISANILGLSGATTPMGIKAVTELAKYPNTYYQICMFFVINATSIQIIPSSVLALRTSMNSANPSSVILPTILATAVSTIIGIVLVKIFIKKEK